ncbi:MAG: peptidase M22 [Oscillospiraceae bacterium]|jgi:N6-L-threonylcarbamoyladenine synthase|nr:peptidase M22 [Oscillospiraceae bacterium]
MFLGIDTSNYTTSCALYDKEQGVVVQEKQLLPVKAGELGLRQSEALFHHTVRLPALLKALFGDSPAHIDGIGVSGRPRSAEGSYMPCFLAGVSAAEAVGAALGLTVRHFSHQEGHIAAALFSCGRLDLLQEPFLAFHVSGGTTEMLLVNPVADSADSDAAAVLPVRRIGGSADLHAGQLVDRVGKALGLPFPAGAALDALAVSYRNEQGETRPAPLRIKVQEGTCSLSGAENQCAARKQEGRPDGEIALACLGGIGNALTDMAAFALREYGTLPLLFSGGVACSAVIRGILRRAYPDALFAAPVFSADNAAGTAILASADFLLPSIPMKSP